MRLLTVANVASHRAGKSTEPGRFMEIFDEVLNAAMNGADPQEVLLNYTDPIEVAAVIEALAAANRQLSRTHEATCQCTPCCVRREEHRRG